MIETVELPFLQMSSAGSAFLASTTAVLSTDPVNVAVPVTSFPK